ncbi:hypothetical protein [Corynebacterium mayonis]|uniref:hypothetical protein n=1 Tax=Corynebacterium mayonis TaxID=3062461 RepID=UPI00313FF9A2
MVTSRLSHLALKTRPLHWHAGNIYAPNLQKQLADLISLAADQNMSDQIILVGGSAGGFASLILATLLPNSTALVWNPQTDLRRYHKSFVDQYERLAWRGKFPQGDGLPIFSAVSLYAEAGTQARVLYLQELSDEHHVTTHLAPFKKAVENKPGVYFYESRWGEGHTPAPKPLVKEFIQMIIDKSSEEDLTKRGFTQVKTK